MDDIGIRAWNEAYASPLPYCRAQPGPSDAGLNLPDSAISIGHPHGNIGRAHGRACFGRRQAARRDVWRTASPSPVVEKIICEFAASRGKRGVPDQEILERCIYPMINEGAKILEEGIAIRASDIDVVWVNGYGWPVYRGGPMFYGDTIGLDKVLAKMQEFQAEFGDNSRPAKRLTDLVAQGKSFWDL